MADTPRTNSVIKSWPRESFGAMSDLARTLERENVAAEARCAGMEALLREGANGFGRVLVATSDQEATYDWLNRCKLFLAAIKDAP